MSLYKQKINPRTGTFNLVPSNNVLTWKAAVSSQANLPLVDNVLYDARMVNDTQHLYVWTKDAATGLLTDWVDQGDIIDLTWAAISGKPSSAVVDIDDAVTKRHLQNTDLYLDTQITHKLYVDGNRSDTYIEDGSFTKPFKKIQDAIDSVTTATVYNRFTIEIMPGEYIEQIIMKNYVHLVSLIPDSVWITSSDGDVVTTSVDANLTNLILIYNGIDSSKVALRCNNGSILVMRELNAFGNYTGVEVNNGAIVIAYGGGTLTGEADSFIAKNGCYVAFYGTVLSGWGNPYYDLVIEAGAWVDVMVAQLYNERLNNLGTLNLVTPGSRISNIPAGSISATTVQEAINELDTEKTTLANVKLDSDIADALSKKHTQNTDTVLDFGGANEISAATLVSNKNLVRNQIHVLELNTMLNAFRIAINGALSFFGMVDSVVDEFEDETGVDTVLSINEDYDSVNDLYKPTLVDTYTKLLLHCDGEDESTDFIDSGVTGHTVTAHGNVKLDTTNKKFGTAGADFPAILNDYVTIPNHSDFEFGTGNFTIDFWTKFTAVTSDIKTFYYQYAGTGNPITDPIIAVNWDGTNLLGLYTQGITGAGYWTATWIPVTDTWYHIAVVREGDNLRFFVNGISIGVSTGVASLDVTGFTSEVLIGTQYDGRPEQPNHYIRGIVGSSDEYRVSKGVARWTSNFTPPINPYAYAADMTLQSNAYVADDVPDEGRLVILMEEIDSVDINTDLLAYISRDDGTTWSQATLTYEGKYDSNIQVLSAVVDISGQPSGQNIKYKLVTVNAKMLYIHGVARLWS